MKKINYNNLYYFHVIATAGSLAAASSTLGLSSSTLSEHLKHVEDEFGQQLFKRNNSRLKLNDAGRKMYRYTKLMFRASQRLEHAFLQRDLKEQVTLDVGVASTVSRTFAAEYFVPLFEDSNTFIRLSQGDYEYLISDLLSFQLDILLSDQKPDFPSDSGLTSEVVKRFPLYIVAATADEKLIESYKENKADIKFLSYSVHSNYRWEVDQHFKSLGIEPLTIGEVDDVLVMKAAVAQGVCIAALPRQVVREEIEKKTFTLLDELELRESSIYVTYHKKNPLDHVMGAVTKLRGAMF